MHRRLIIVLIFVSGIMLVLVEFPGPLFQSFQSHSARLAPTFRYAAPIDRNDAEMIALRARAETALVRLKSKSHESDLHK